MFKEKEEVKNLRGGLGSCFVEKAKELMVNCKMYARITILPGSSIGMHVHDVDEEMVYVLSGSGKAYIGDEFIQIKQGEAHYAKQGKNHSIINDTKDNLVILAIINE
jgi:quercetin dioxygenase-like cupin family protein